MATDREAALAKSEAALLRTQSRLADAINALTAARKAVGLVNIRPAAPPIRTHRDESGDTSAPDVSIPT
eukprot:4401741-Pyramimonas_sp.AAC.1